MKRTLTLRIHALCLIAPAWLLGACTTTNPTVPTELTQGKSLAVSAQLGDELQLASVAMLVFWNKRETQKVEAWELDEVATRAAQAAVRPGYFSAVSPASDPRDPARALSPSTETDLMLRIRPASAADSLTSTNQQITGIGLFERHHAVHKVFGHAVLELTLFDTRTNTVIGKSIAFQHWPIRAGTGATVWSLKDYGQAGPVLVNLAKAQPTAQELEQIRPDMLRAVEAAVRSAVDDLGIGRAAPAKP